VSDCCLTPNEQYEELISKNSGKPYKNTNFDKEDILANHKSFVSSLNIPINEENCELSTFCNINTHFTFDVFMLMFQLNNSELLQIMV
jgi:hypothetical protein